MSNVKNHIIGLLCRWKIPVLLSLLLTLAPSLRAADVALEARAKASYIYNCASSVTWPSARASESKMVIGVIGDDTVRSVLAKELAGKTIKGRTVSVIEPSNSETKSCHLIYVGSGGRGATSSVIAQARDNGILTFGTADEDFMIRFVVIKDSIRLEGNHSRMKQAGLKPTADLLRILAK